MAEDSDSYAEAAQHAPEAGQAVEFWKMLANGYVGLEGPEGLEPIDYRDAITLKNTALLYSVNKSDRSLTDDRGPRICDIMEAAWNFVAMEDNTSDIKGSFADSDDCQSDGGPEGYVEARAFSSPAVATLWLNMAAFVTNIEDDAEVPASGAMIASCFYSEPGTNHRQINDQTMDMIFREKNGLSTVISTAMGLEESSEFRPMAEQKYMVHPYYVQAGNGMEGVEDHSVIRPVSDFVADTSLAGKPIAMPLQPHRAHELHEKLFDTKFCVLDEHIDPKEEALLVLMSIINRLHVTYHGLGHEKDWARLFWRLYRIIHKGKPGMLSTDPVPPIYPKFADDLTLQTRIMFNSITSVRLASLDGKTRLYSVIYAQMLRRPELSIEELTALDKCNIPHPNRNNTSMFREMGKGATIGLVYQKSATVNPANEIPAQFTRDDMLQIARYSNSVQTTASLNRNREFVDVFVSVINELIIKGDDCTSNAMAAPIDPVDLRTEHQQRDGQGAFAKFMKEGNHFEAAHASIAGTLMDETTGFAATATIAFKKQYRLTTTEDATVKFLQLLGEKCRTAYTGALMRGAPLGLMAMAMLVTDFCHSKTSLLKMKTLFVRGARPGKEMPIPWNRKGATYHKETIRERESWIPSETTGPHVYEILQKFLFAPKILLGSAFLDYARHTNTLSVSGELDGIAVEAASGKATFTVKFNETILKKTDMKKSVVKDRFVVLAGEAIVDVYLAFGLMIPIPTKLQEKERSIYNVLTTNFDTVLTEEVRMNEVARANEAIPEEEEEAGTDEAVSAEEARPNEGGPWSNIPAAVLVVVWLTCHGNRFGSGSSGSSGSSGGRTGDLTAKGKRYLCFGREWADLITAKGFWAQYEGNSWKKFEPRFHFVDESQCTQESLTLLEVITVLIFNCGPAGEPGYLSHDYRAGLDEALSSFECKADYKRMVDSGKDYIQEVQKLGVFLSEKKVPPVPKAPPKAAGSVTAALTALTAATAKAKKPKQPEISGNSESRAAALQEEDSCGAEEEDSVTGGGEHLLGIMNEHALSMRNVQGKALHAAQLRHLVSLDEHLEAIIEQALRVACVAEYSDRNLHVGKVGVVALAKKAHAQDKILSGAAKGIVFAVKAMVNSIFTDNGCPDDYDEVQEHEGEDAVRISPEAKLMECFDMKSPGSEAALVYRGTEQERAMGYGLAAFAKPPAQEKPTPNVRVGGAPQHLVKKRSAADAAGAAEAAAGGGSSSLKTTRTKSPDDNVSDLDNGDKNLDEQPPPATTIAISLPAGAGAGAQQEENALSRRDIPSSRVGTKYNVPFSRRIRAHVNAIETVPETPQVKRQKIASQEKHQQGKK